MDAIDHRVIFVFQLNEILVIFQEIFRTMKFFNALKQAKDLVDVVSEAAEKRINYWRNLLQ